MIYEEIKKANLQALKEKDGNSRTILGMVASKIKLAEINLRESNKELQESDVVAILQKTIKELMEEAENYKKVSNDEMFNIIMSQKNIVNKFLPQMMSEVEIENIIAQMDDKGVPAVMKKFKAEFAGKVDMRMVQNVLKRIN